MSIRLDDLIEYDLVNSHHEERYIMLNCFVLGNGTSFTFDKKNRDVVTFSHFRDAIKERIETVKSDDLRLWKVCIDTRKIRDDYLELKKSPVKIDVEKKFGGEELEPSWEIAESFQDTPLKEHIHIIVQPSATTSLKRPISELSSQSMRARKLVRTEGPVNALENFYVPFEMLDSTRSLEEAIDRNLCVLLVGHFQSGKTSVLHYLKENRKNHFYVHSSTLTNGFLPGLCKLLSLSLCANCADLHDEIENKYRDEKIVILIDEFDRFLFNSKKNNSIEDAIDQIRELTKLISDKSIGIKSIVYTGSYSITTILKDGVSLTRKVVETLSQESSDGLSKDESLFNKEHLLEPQPIPSPLNSAKTIQASDFTKSQHMLFFNDIQEDRHIKISEEVLDDIFSITNGYAGLECLLASLCMEYSANEKTLEFDKWNERFTEFRRNPTNQQIKAVNHIEKHFSDSNVDNFIENAKKLLGRFLRSGILHASEINESDTNAIMHLQAIGIIKKLDSELFGFTSNIILDLLSTKYYPLYRKGLATIPNIKEPQKFLKDVLNLLQFIRHDIIFHSLAANLHSFSEAMIQGELYALLRSAVSNPTYKFFRETRTLRESEKKCDLWVCNGNEYGIECKVNKVSNDEINSAVKQAIGYTKGRKKACSMFVFNFVPSDSISNNHEFFFPSVVYPEGFYFETVHILYSKSNRIAQIFRRCMEPENISFAAEDNQ